MRHLLNKGKTRREAGTQSKRSRAAARRVCARRLGCQLPRYDPTWVELGGLDMRSHLTKLMAVMVPVVTAVAIAPGPASASLGQCRGRKVAVPVTIAGSLYDANQDGIVCQMINPAGKVIQQDDRW